MARRRRKGSRKGKKTISASAAKKKLARIKRIVGG